MQAQAPGRGGDPVSPALLSMDEAVDAVFADQARRREEGDCEQTGEEEVSEPPTLDYAESTDKPSPLLANVAFVFACMACASSIYGWINIDSFTMRAIYNTLALSGVGAIVGVIGRLLTRRPLALIATILSIFSCGVATAEYAFVWWLVRRMTHS